MSEKDHSSPNFVSENMNLELPESWSIDAKRVAVSPEIATEVVRVCWRAAERHASEGKLEAAILLLDRLLSSPYGTHLELYSRLRLAQWCFTFPAMKDVVMSQLERAVRTNLKS